MEYSMEAMNEMCLRIEALASQMEHGSLGSREEQVVSEIVASIQRIGAGIAWAYGTSLDLGERFAQPFVDSRMCHHFRGLLQEKQLGRDSQSRVAHQILQTIHIMLSHTPQESTLFCNLSAGFYLNEVVSCRLDFRCNDDLLHMWLTVVKEIAMMLTQDNYMLFYKPMSENPFPIFSEAIRFYHHQVAQVRTIVQAITLEIFAKLNNEDFWMELQFQQILAEFCTHVCCLLREFWRMVDANMKSTHPTRRKDFKEALRIQNDILLYVNDVFVCDIRIVSETLQEKLLHFAILPVLVRSMLYAPFPAGDDGEFLLSPSVASFLLYDALTTLKCAPISAAVASALMQNEIPEQVSRLIAGSPPQTPKQYLASQADWGSITGAAMPIMSDASVSDEVLYKMPTVCLVDVLKIRDGLRPPPSCVPNGLLESLERMLSMLVDRNSSIRLAPCSVLALVALLLRTFRSSQDTLGDRTVERLGSALCHVLAAHDQLRWPAYEGALCALHELATMADTPPGTSRRLLSPLLEKIVLQPLASEVLKASKEGDGPPQVAVESWLDEFQEQWVAHQNGPHEPPVSAPERELFELGSLGAPPEPPGAPEGRARAVRILLAAHRSHLNLDAGRAELSRNMPGLDDVELEELAKYEPGVPVHVGRVNRVKCSLVRQNRNGGQEVVYLLPAQALLVLVRPDEHKPFWAIPVIAEPLRTVRWRPTSGDSVRIEVTSPRSPVLKHLFEEQKFGSPFAPPTRGPVPPLPIPGANGVPDGMAMSMPMALLGGSVVPTDRIGHSLPPSAMVESSESQPFRSAVMTITFGDERRKRVGCKVVLQARHHVCQRMCSGLSSFLEGVRDGK